MGTADDDVHAPASPRYRRMATVFVGYTIAVILWGALVRATLSGDGCGDHWPLCNGEVVPAAPATKTIVELTHRITSGLAWIGALAFWIVAARGFPKDPLVRRGAFLGFFFMTTEALVGAGLVIFRMVAENPDHARGWWAGAHLVNTFLLLTALTLHAWWAHGGGRLRLPTRGLRWAFGAVFVGLLFVGITGAIAALGDTLFPVSSLREGFEQDLDATAHVFLRLRVWHPLSAVVVGAAAAFLAGSVAMNAEGRWRARAWGLAGVVVVQLALGSLNVLLLAPVWLQLVHLLVADLIWVGLLWLALGAPAWATRAETVEGRTPEPAGA